MIGLPETTPRAIEAIDSFRSVVSDRRYADKKMALHFSGGKDSMACLYLLMPWVMSGRVHVYWLNTGDVVPETISVIERMREWVPIIEVRTDAVGWRKQYGDPSDIAPASASPLGRMYGMSDERIVGRFDCCWHNLMRPMHERMVSDGIDIVIRGTKLSDTGRVPHVGDASDYEVMLPLMEWTHDDVFSYLKTVGAPVNPIYEHFTGISAPECLTCTAWWDDGKAAYLKARHPEKLNEYRASLQTIKAALRKHLADLDSELEA